MIKNLLLITLGFVGVRKLFDVKKTVDATDNLQFIPEGVKWLGFSNGAFNLKLVFNVINPIDKDVLLNFLFTDVILFDDKKLTTISLENWNKKIKKEAKSKIELPIRVFISDILFLGWTLIKNFKNGILPKNLTLKGYVKLNGYTVPFNENVNII